MTINIMKIIINFPMILKFLNLEIIVLMNTIGKLNGF